MAGNNSHAAQGGLVIPSVPVGTQKQLFVAPEVTELGRLNKLTKQFGGTFTP